MNQKHLKSFAGALWFNVIEKLMFKKGDQYAGQEDHALANFGDAARIWDKSIPYELLQYTTKHWAFIIRWAKGDTGKMRDKVKVAVTDIIVYMILLLFWLQLVADNEPPSEEED